MGNIELIVNFLKEQKEMDFTGCSSEMLSRRITLRFIPTFSTDFASYFQYLQANVEELDHLVQTITIKVSHFFRNPLDFEILNKIIAAILLKKEEENTPLRIWSAGCSTGEEAYSMAIMINELNSHNYKDINIFGTDIDKTVLDQAKAGIYNMESVKEVKYGLLQKYFTAGDDVFHLSDKIKQMVSFSQFDLLTEHSSVPPESVYGSFDIVLCRNVLIYYDTKNQNIIWQKLVRSLSPDGYLSLGEAEKPYNDYRNSFRRISSEVKLYRRI